MYSSLLCPIVKGRAQLLVSVDLFDEKWLGNGKIPEAKFPKDCQTRKSNKTTDISNCALPFTIKQRKEVHMDHACSQVLQSRSKLI